MNIFEEVTNLRQGLSELIGIRNSLYLEFNELFENQRSNALAEEFQKKYFHLESIINSCTQELFNQSQLIIKNSNFNSGLIGTFLAKLMSDLEDKWFIYQSEGYIKYDEEAKRHESWIYLLINPENANISYCTSAHFRGPRALTIENGIIIAETFGETLEHELSFYKLDSDGNLVCTISNKQYPYLQDFINELIEFRINNNAIVSELNGRVMMDIFEKVLNKYRNKGFILKKDEN